MDGTLPAEQWQKRINAQKENLIKTNFIWWNIVYGFLFDGAAEFIPLLDSILHMCHA